MGLPVEKFHYYYNPISIKVTNPDYSRFTCLFYFHLKSFYYYSTIIKKTKQKIMTVMPGRQSNMI